MTCVLDVCCILLAAGDCAAVFLGESVGQPAERPEEYQCLRPSRRHRQAVRRRGLRQRAGRGTTEAGRHRKQDLH